MQTPGRWERILELKPKPLVAHLVEEVAQLFANDLRTWPPEVEVEQPQLMALLVDAPLRPDARLYREAFRLARLDLTRAFDAYDDYLRNGRWQEAGLAAKDRAMLLFLSRFMVEQLLGLSEATEGRLKRAHLLQVLEGTEQRFFSAEAS